MTKFGIEVKICAVLFFLITYATTGFSQLVYNNGTDIYAKQGAIVFVDGTVQNNTGILEVEEVGNSFAEIIIQQDFINNATAGGDGYYRVLGNWVNNNIFNAGTGTVFLEGGNQFIDGSVSTYFNNLTLDGTGFKTQAIDQYCTGILDLKHLELQNENYGFYIQNTNVNAIVRTTGFVSALNGGFLSRKTNLSSMYLFPVGSSLGTMRYRPAEITPENALANTYTVRMANVLATTESYDVDAIPSGICEVNPEFYHQVNRTAGSSAIKLNIFYNQTQDGEWDGLANWTTTPDLWSTILSTAINAGVPFNEAIIPTWNDFSEIPYILYRIKPEAAIIDPGSLCSNDAPINLTAATTGGTWLGAGVSSTGVFNPTTAGAGTHTITYNVGTGTCAGTDQIDIIVNPSPTVTITNPGDLCSTDLAFNLTVSPTGGIWSGTGFTDTDAGTFSPAAADIGANNITYELTVLGCTGTDNLTINVFDSPDATITNPGTLCSNDAAFDLTAASTGGTWSGTGITDATNGTFDPANAGAGTHTITYNVGTGTCAGTDQIDITVNATPIAIITNPGDFCSTDDAVNLIATPTGGTWSGTGITDINAGTFDPSSATIGANIVTYNITVNGCSGIDQTTINVNNSPNVNIDPAGPFCFDYITVQLTAASEGGTWSGAGVSSNGEFNIAQAGVGIHEINYEFGGNCGGIGTIEIEIYPSDIDAHYMVYSPLCIGGKDGYVEFNLNGGTPPYTLEWGEDSYTASNIIPDLTGGHYVVTVIDNNGCSIEVDDIIVENGKQDCIYIPNAFTPNGDGINDEWVIANLISFSNYGVKVFNRWGQEVYSGVAGSDPWDGTLNNKPLPTGAYVYIVEIDEIEKKFVGVVTLIK